MAVFNKIIEMSTNSVQILNSFTFNFVNTTNSVQTISLFQEGSNSEFNVQNVLTTGQTSNLNSNFPQCSLPVWNFVGNQSFYYFGNPLLTSLTQYPTSISDISIRGTGNIVFETDTFVLFNIPVHDGENIQVVNDRINQYLRDFATTSDFRSPSGQVMTFNFTFDFSIYQLTPLPIALAGYVDPYGVSIQYPTDSTIRLSTIVNTGSSALPSFIDCDLAHLTQVASANGVEVIDSSNVSYTEIQQSQNGGALDIDSLVINIGNAPSNFEKESQLLQPFRFKKIDVNGNEYEIQKVQTIDPYQYQFSFGKVDMTDSGESLVLDGNTRFLYSVEPQTSVFLTYNYVQARNSTFGTESAQEEMQQDLKNIAGLDDDSSNERELVISSNLAYESDATQPTKNVSNKTNYFIPLLLGGIALYLLFNLKSNQKWKLF
jgi:hypothetical protein